MKIASASTLAMALAATAALSGCYVVPMQHVSAAPAATVVVPAAPQPMTFAARLYRQ